MRRDLLRATAAGLAGMGLPGLGGCVAVASGTAMPPDGWGLPEQLGQGVHDVLLLGEVHDSVVQHRLRLNWLRQLSEAHPWRADAALTGNAGAPAKASMAPAWRISLVMEQFDLERQADIERFVSALSGQARMLPGSARALATAAGFNFSGWEWSFYEPVLQLALRERWTIHAANLSATKAMQVARGTGTSLLAEHAWREEDEQAMRAEIRIAHCDALPEVAVPVMVRAQRARDLEMAHAVRRAWRQESPSVAGRKLVIFLAGNGHVRRDFGVPRYLRALEPGMKVFSVGLIEVQTGAEAGQAALVAAFDHVVKTPAQVREDPCIAFKARKRTPER